MRRKLKNVLEASYVFFVYVVFRKHLSRESIEFMDKYWKNERRRKYDLWIFEMIKKVNNYKQYMNMKNLKVVKVDSQSLEFDNGMVLSSYHDQACCESHYLWMSDLTIEDFDGLEFDLSNDDFFDRIEGYGIALKPKRGFPVRIPGYGSNNGWYSSDLALVIHTAEGFLVGEYDISECQEIND